MVILPPDIPMQEAGRKDKQMGFKTSEIFLEYNNLRLFITFNILVKTIQWLN